ncbi:MAG: manganese efflux pump [Bacillaceae bacterium]|nr:manganese efflux pump [Bacillaceae bacterium]
MTNLHVALLALAISLGPLAIMIVEGAMVSKIQYRELLKSSLLIGSCQTLALLIGQSIYPLALRMGGEVHQVFPRSALRFLAFIIFFGLGGLMLKRGFKLEYIHEHRQPSIKDRKVLMITVISSIKAFVTGVGLSFAQVDITPQFYIVLIISVLSMMAGAYIGYWFGYEKKPDAYRLSSIIYLVMATSFIIG